MRERERERERERDKGMQGECFQPDLCHSYHLIHYIKSLFCCISIIVTGI